MRIEKKKLSEIIPYYNNPRDNSKAVEPVMESFRKFGFIKPILVDSNMVIVCGHTRYIASFQLGLEYVPIIVTNMSEESAKRFRLLDNVLAEKSSFDENQLVEELRQLEVPKEMQAFFFEDIDMMLNFDIHGFEQNAEYMQQEQEQQQNEEIWEEPGNKTEETNPEAEEEDDKNDYLFRVMKRPDGTKYMRVICPYCGNVEEIEIE